MSTLDLVLEAYYIVFESINEVLFLLWLVIQIQFLAFLNSIQRVVDFISISSSVLIHLSDLFDLIIEWLEHLLDDQFVSLDVRSRITLLLCFE